MENTLSQQIKEIEKQKRKHLRLKKKKKEQIQTMKNAVNNKILIPKRRSRNKRMDIKMIKSSTKYPIENGSKNEKTSRKCYIRLFG